MASVFLSYARSDAEKAKRLAAALSRCGHDVWWDRRIHGGAHYSKEIQTALAGAEVVVVLWSKASSESDWVQDEAAVGRDSGRLVPVAIEAVEPPLGFRQVQTLDLARWKGRTAPPELLHAIQAVSGGGSNGEEGTRPARPAAKRLPRQAFAALAAIAMLVTVFGLWQVAGGRFGGTAETPTLAVLPFADLSPEGNKAYFSEGVGEAILSLLAREPGIKVIGRSSAAQFHPGTSDFREIRKALGVTHFLEGSARTAGDQLRMSVRLIDARDGAQIWAEDYQRELSNIFAVQDEIGRSVAERLKGTLRMNTTARQQQTAAVDIYTLYLALRAKMRGRDPRELSEALELARRINAADPSYAPAHAAHAELLHLISTDNYGPLPRETAFQRALPRARRAIELAAGSAEGHAALGLLLAARNPDAAIESLTRAINLDPSRAETRLWRASSYLYTARDDEALNDFRRVVEMEPLWGVAQINLVAPLATAGRHAEADAVTRQFETRGGSAGFAAWSKGANAYLAGDLSEGVRHLLDARREGLAVPQIQEFLSWFFHLASLNHTAADQVSPRQSVYGRLFVSGQRQALLKEVAEAGSEIWDSPDSDVAVQALAMTRDWARLANLYGRRRSSVQVCPDLWGGAVGSRRRGAGSVAVNIAQALFATGQESEANRLLTCVERRLAKFRTDKIRESGFDDAMIAFTRAQISALRGRNPQALQMLDAAVDRKWLGLYGGNLSDYPAFDPLPAQDLARIQRKLDRQLARERAEIQSFCPACR